MSIYDLVMKRRTIRRFQQKPLPRDLLDRLLDAGRLAPSAANLQPLEFITVDSPEMCAQIFPLTTWAGYLPDGTPQEGERPTAWMLILHNRILSPVADQDVGFAAASMVLVAEDEGVASCAIGSVQRGPLRQALGIPEHYEVPLVIALGYPAETAVAEAMVGDEVKYWRDQQGVHHVPKRPKAKPARTAS